MSLSAGARLGSYDVIGLLGAGGMGEVYRARDTKLNREVAIKVLPDTVGSDADRIARFKREAQTLASLNHPNIAQIHGFEDAGGLHALVMELVEGPTLADRIALGPIPLDEALPIARQIADALECAHEHGIIHRDLKPANVKVRADGTVKVLDFGLAKAMDPAAGSDVNVMNSPTQSIRATQAGFILGTAAYMSPEQASGKTVDKRSDLWAFGVVLLEMLTGRRVFDGETVSHVLAAVLTKEPDWSALPRSTPSPIRRLLRRCLEKDAKRRLDSAADARLEIDDAMRPSAEFADTAGAADSRRRPGALQRILPWAVAAAALLTAGALAARGINREEATPVYATLDAPTNYVLGDDDGFATLPNRTPMVFTPDGGALIIQAASAHKPQLFLRSLDRPDARPIAGTDDARVPFVSPDGAWVGFWTGDELRKVPIQGGAPTTICALSAGPLGPFGAAWGPGDLIVFGDVRSGRIMRVLASGGAPEAVTAAPALTSRRRHTSPVFLPDGRRILFTDVSTDDASDARIMVQSLDGGDAKLVMSSATDGRLLPSGHLGFMRLGTLMIVPFDAARAEVRGDAVAAMSNVMQVGLIRRAGVSNPGAAMFAVSSRGALATIRGGLTGLPTNALVWQTHDGRSDSPADPEFGAPAGARLNTRISPDGSRAIVSVQTPMRIEVWIADWSRHVWTACADCAGALGIAVWSPDGRRLLLGRNGTLVVHTLDGSTPDQERLREADRSLVPMVWRADGRILYLSSPDLTRYEIKLLEPGQSAGRVVVPLGSGHDADVSPDGRWLAYTSIEQGRSDVTVQAFPGPGPRTAVSVGGAENPRWSADGRTLYYLAGAARDLFAVEIASSGELKAGTPRLLFRPRTTQGCAPVRCYDISADGRFLFHELTKAAPDTATRMDLILNWSATLPKAR